MNNRHIQYRVGGTWLDVLGSRPWRSCCCFERAVACWVGLGSSELDPDPTETPAPPLRSFACSPARRVKLPCVSSVCHTSNAVAGTCRAAGDFVCMHNCSIYKVCIRERGAVTPRAVRALVVYTGHIYCVLSVARAWVLEQESVMELSK